MSFVGPRPLLPVDQPIDSKSRLLVRPGLTGWAQIRGGRQISPAKKAVLDMWYVRNMSLTLDLKIMLKTVPVLIFGERVTEAAIVRARREMHWRLGSRATSSNRAQLFLQRSWPKSNLRSRNDGQNSKLFDCISGHGKPRGPATYATFSMTPRARASRAKALFTPRPDLASSIAS